MPGVLGAAGMAIPPRVARNDRNSPSLQYYLRSVDPRLGNNDLCIRAARPQMKLRLFSAQLQFPEKG